jgi:hypothetical protein
LGSRTRQMPRRSSGRERSSGTRPCPLHRPRPSPVHQFSMPACKAIEPSLGGDPPVAGDPATRCSRLLPSCNGEAVVRPYGNDGPPPQQADSLVAAADRVDGVKVFEDVEDRRTGEPVVRRVGTKPPRSTSSPQKLPSHVAVPVLADRTHTPSANHPETCRRSVPELSASGGNSVRPAAPPPKCARRESDEAPG